MINDDMTETTPNFDDMVKFISDLHNAYMIDDDLREDANIVLKVIHSINLLDVSSILQSQDLKL
jgi:hypothetical protein